MNYRSNPQDKLPSPHLLVVLERRLNALELVDLEALNGLLLGEVATDANQVGVEVLAVGEAHVLLLEQCQLQKTWVCLCECQRWASYIENRDT